MATASLTGATAKLHRTLATFTSQAEDWQARTAILAELSHHALPPELEAAFLIPAEAGTMSTAARVAARSAGAGVLQLKSKALEILSDPASLTRLVHVKDPHDPIARAATLAILEFLVAIRCGRIGTAYIRIHRDEWLTVADHFGLWRLRYMLEDALFAVTDPHEYHLMLSLLQRQNRIHQGLFQDIIDIVKNQCAQSGLDSIEIVARKKNVYGVFLKMHRKGRNINHIKDLFGLRVITQRVQDCYRAVELLHHLWPHYPEHYVDYIAHPKANGYRSIHTVVCGIGKNDVEFQIRTRLMDEIAKFGPANHAIYKSSARGAY